jgi:DNA helicase-2/ATP-dependent DNA helicase PcrA
MTRAKSYLFLYSVREIYRKEAQVSRYIGEIWPEEDGERQKKTAKGRKKPWQIF